MFTTGIKKLALKIMIIFEKKKSCESGWFCDEERKEKDSRHKKRLRLEVGGQAMTV